jgi:hypothetical protein
VLLRIFFSIGQKTKRESRDRVASDMKKKSDRGAIHGSKSQVERKDGEGKPVDRGENWTPHPPEPMNTVLDRTGLDNLKREGEPERGGRPTGVRFRQNEGRGPPSGLVLRIQRSRLGRTLAGRLVLNKAGEVSILLISCPREKA